MRCLAAAAGGAHARGEPIMDDEIGTISCLGMQAADGMQDTA